MGSPVFFTQRRPGLNGKIFTIYKFRTMDITEENLRDTDRINRLGLFIRSTSLDELPELWNVLKGDMSLVGPRPLLEEYLSLYDEIQIRRHEVRPGITGWAQIHGRNKLCWAKRFELDVWYVDNHNLLLDLKILWSTSIKVFIREGISETGQATMSKFKGTSHWKK
jgi:lipopolysaccharide/colanic/teichoic acid biosynthesis glycosyltransferase